jgi:hypothetical protein
MAGNTTDVQVYDGSSWISIAGEDGKPIDTVTINATTKPPTDCDTLATDLEANGTVSDNANGNLTLAMNLEVPAGKCGQNGTPATAEVNDVTNKSVDYDKPLKVTVEDATPSDNQNLSLNFDFEIPRGEPGTGITIKGSVAIEPDLPDCATYAGDEGDMYIVATNANGDKGHGFVYNGKDSDCWDDVGQIKGQDGVTPNVGAEVIENGTTTLLCGSDATASARRKPGSPDTDPIIEFSFGIPKGCDGDGVDLVSSVTVNMNQCQDALPIENANGTFAESGSPVNGVQDYALTLNLPRPPKVTKGLTAPTTDRCYGDFHILTD